MMLLTLASRVLFLLACGFVMSILVAKAQIYTPTEKVALKPQNEPYTIAENTQPEMEYVGEYRCTFYAKDKLGVKNLELTEYESCATVRIGGFPIGTVLFIENWGFVRVQDTFSKRIKSKDRLDLFVSSKAEALEMGIKKMKVWIVK